MTHVNSRRRLVSDVPGPKSGRVDESLALDVAEVGLDAGHRRRKLVHHDLLEGAV